jgi:phosphatidylserine decarboxylase precursor
MRSSSRRRTLVPLVLLALAGCAGAGDAGDAGDAGADYGPVVTGLTELFDARPDLEASLTAAIDSAALPDVESLSDFYAHVDELVTWIPVEREIIPKVLSIHYVVNQAPGDALNQDDEFNEWLSSLAEAWGAFLDTPASAAGIETFAALPDYEVDDFFPGPSGWQTFNQFFAREIKPGKRPVHAPSNDSVIVSPADAIFMGAWPINEDATVTLKGVEWSIAELLDGSPYADAFSGGTYAHTFLRITDYHRYHVPVAGVVREVRNVHGRVFIDVVKNEDGSLSGANGDTYQFNQERGLVILESPTVGLVALVPVGMTLISSVNLEPDVGAELRKGEEFGYFQFGGSDIVLLFQNPDVELEAAVGTRYLQGQRIGRLDRGE